MRAISPDLMLTKITYYWPTIYFTTHLQVEFQIPAVIVGDSPHKDSICRIANFSDGAMVTCSSVRKFVCTKINAEYHHCTGLYSCLLIIGWCYLFLVTQADTKAHQKGN